MLCAAFHNCVALCGGAELFKIAHQDRPIESMHNKLEQPKIQIKTKPLGIIGHLTGGKHSAADMVAKGQAILSEPELQRAMFDGGYFPPNTPRGESQIGGGGSG